MALRGSWDGSHLFEVSTLPAAHIHSLRHLVLTNYIILRDHVIVNGGYSTVRYSQRGIEGDKKAKAGYPHPRNFHYSTSPWSFCSNEIYCPVHKLNIKLGYRYV